MRAIWTISRASLATSRRSACCPCENVLRGTSEAGRPRRQVRDCRRNGGRPPACPDSSAPPNPIPHGRAMLAAHAFKAGLVDEIKLRPAHHPRQRQEVAPGWRAAGGSSSSMNDASKGAASYIFTIDYGLPERRAAAAILVYLATKSRWTSAPRRILTNCNFYEF